MHSYRELYTPWVILATIFVVVGVGLDATAFATSAWGEALEDDFYTYIGIFRICNGTRELTRRDKLEIWRSDPWCYFPTENNLTWLPVALGMEYLGALMALGSLVAIIVLMILIRVDWMRSRMAVVSAIPLTCLAGFFNMVGCVVIAVKLEEDLFATPRWSLWMDASGVACFILAGVFSIMELQGYCAQQRGRPIGRGLLRPI